MNGVEDEVVDCEARRPTRAETVLTEWAWDTYKKSIPFANEVLRLLLPLLIALVAGSVTWLGQVVHPVFQAVIAGLFLVGLIACFAGVMPFEGRAVNLMCPEEVRLHKQAALERKLYWLGLASWATVLGFVSAITGVLARAFA